MLAVLRAWSVFSPGCFWWFNILWINPHGDRNQEELDWQSSLCQTSPNGDPLWGHCGFRKNLMARPDSGFVRELEKSFYFVLLEDFRKTSFINFQYIWPPKVRCSTARPWLARCLRRLLWTCKIWKRRYSSCWYSCLVLTMLRLFLLLFLMIGVLFLPLSPSSLSLLCIFFIAIHPPTCIWVQQNCSLPECCQSRRG